MHSKIIALAVAGSSASAFVLPRDDGCTFEVTASGGKSGTVGQLDDGQNRIGGSFAPATYNISNGGITDANGRGCILTPPTTQWQCDVGATPTTGFSISSSGEIEYNGSGTFYACGATDTEYNIYTVPVKDQKNCVEVTLSSGGKCTGNGSGGGASSSSPSKPAKSTETEKSTAPAPWTGTPTPSASWNETETWASTEKPSPATTSPVSLTTSTVYTTTVDTITSCAATVTDCPAESQSTVLITKTIAVSTTVCPVTETEKSPPATWEPKPSPPTTWESKPSPPATWESKPAPPASYESKPWAPASQVSKPTPPASQESKPAPPATQASKPAPPASYESKTWAPASASPASAPPASVPPASAPPASAPAVSAPVASPSAPAECQATIVYVTVTKEAPLPVVLPSTNGSPKSPTSSAAPSPPAASSKASPPPDATAPSSKSTPSQSTANPVASSPATPVAHGSACPTSLTGAYQTPHLIVPISSEHPDWAYGTSYNGQINSTTSTIFNFDIPQDYKGKQCSIVFLFPNKKDLETSSYEFGGSGSLDVTELSTGASQKTSWSNAPSVKKDLGSIALQPGNSYVVATGDCQAGTTQSIELSSKGGLSLNFFEDYNPSPSGLYITSC
ncbi:hypothetical protein Q7P35_007006 [Cladosporium inversicolor]